MLAGLTSYVVEQFTRCLSTSLLLAIPGRKQSCKPFGRHLSFKWANPPGCDLLLPHKCVFKVFSFLAPLSQRLIGELIGWQGWCCLLSVVKISNDLWAYWSQISYGASMGLGNGSLFAGSPPGPMTNMATMSIYGKIPSNLLLRNQWTDFNETWYVVLGTQGRYSLFKWWSWDDPDLF